MSSFCIKQMLHSKQTKTGRTISLLARFFYDYFKNKNHHHDYLLEKFVFFTNLLFIDFNFKRKEHPQTKKRFVSYTRLKIKWTSHP